MAITQLPPIPEKSELAEDSKTIVPQMTAGGKVKEPFKLRLLVKFEWIKWLQSVAKALNAAPLIVGNLWSIANVASIAAATIPVTATSTASAPNQVGNGLYRISWYLRVSIPSSGTSTIQLILGWVSGGVTMQQVNAAVTGNATTSYQSGSIAVQTDAGSELTYQTIYGSIGITDMQYELYITVEEIAGQPRNGG